MDNKEKVRVLKYMAYVFIVCTLIFTMFRLVTFVFSMEFMGSTYKLGERVVEMFGFPESIG